MEYVPAFEMRDGIAVLRIRGRSSFELAVQRVAAGIAHALAQGHDCLLVDGRDVAGFNPPSIPARHEMVRYWAAAAQGRVRVAVVIGGAFIDAEKFAVLAAANFGLVANVFETMTEASDWLLGQRAETDARHSVNFEPGQLWRP
ncbi:MAG: hypothetical protein ABIO38_02365 [Luteimonas sp.]